MRSKPVSLTSPLAIDIILKAYTGQVRSDYNEHTGYLPPAQTEIIAAFIEDGLIVDLGRGKYSTTDKGKQLVVKLSNTFATLLVN